MVKTQYFVEKKKEASVSLAKLSHKPLLGRYTLAWEMFKYVHEHVQFHVNSQVMRQAGQKQWQQLA